MALFYQMKWQKYLKFRDPPVAKRALLVASRPRRRPPRTRLVDWTFSLRTLRSRAKLDPEATLLEEMEWPRTERLPSFGVVWPLVLL